ncbi:MAG: DUF3631 domain-containing protein [Verrucomicrobiota bacterium]
MKTSIESDRQSSPKPGEIFTRPDGTKAVAGIDGEEFELHGDGERLVDVMPGAEVAGAPAHNDMIHIAKGEAVQVQIIYNTAEPPIVAWHRWLGGLRLNCPEKTSPDLLAEADRGRDCPLCQGILPLAGRFLIPVFLLARMKPSGDWRKEPRQRAKILPINCGGPSKRYLATANPATTPVFIAGRKDDQFGCYYFEKSESPAVEIKCPLTPQMSEVYIEPEEELKKLAGAAKTIAGIELKPGRVAKWTRRFPGLPLIAVWPGRKKPVRTGYLDPAKWREWMKDAEYLRRMDEGQGIALLLLAGYVAVDLDRDEDIAEFERRNPWVKGSMSVRGGRGLKYFVKITGEYPQRVLHIFSNGEHVGEFRGATLAVLDNIHPCGKLYEVRNEDHVAEITYNQICWPDGWKVESPACREFERGFDERVEGGLLNLKLLKNVRQHPTKDGALQAQCPACAEAGSDKSGNHLILFDAGEGRYGCAVDQSAEHYSRIFELGKREPFRQRERTRETIEKLASLDLVEYDQRRFQAAADLGVRTGTLDQLVEEKRHDKKATAKTGFFQVAEPWPEPVDGAELVDDLTKTAHRFLVLPPGGYLIFALWSIHTHCFDTFDYTPILNFRSPLKRCGKSLCLDLLKHFCSRAIKFDTPTAAVLFRLIEEYRPTVEIDEWDSLAGEETQIAVRGILNSGFHKNGCVARCVGDDHEPRLFSTFAPKAISGIGELPDTAQDRAITIQMHRKLRSERRERFRKFDGTEPYRKCARWTADNRDKLAAAQTVLPSWMNDREMDIWEPLLAVADLCGCGEDARDAAYCLCPHEEEDNSLVVELLRDIREIFQGEAAVSDEGISTHTLLGRLNNDESRPWATLIKGQPMHSRRLADLLRPFGISSKQFKYAGITGRGGKGYDPEQFQDAFTRYL